MARKSPQYDPQREEVYRMEKRGLPGLNRSQFSRLDHRSLLKQLCREFNVDIPKLRFVKAEAWAGFYEPDEPGKTRISLSTAYTSGTSAMTLVHEFAHHALYRWDPEEHLAPHGPEFVGVYGDALGMAGLMPWKGWQHLCEQYGVACMDTDSIRTISGLERAVKKRAAEAALSATPRRKAVS